MGTQLVKVDVHGDAIEAAREGSDVWVPLRRVCEVLGLNPQSQARALRGRRWAVGAEKYLTGPDGKSYAMFCVHLDTLPMWLANIHEGKVKDGARANLIRLQLDAARVLRDHFFGAKQDAPTVAASLPAIAGIVRESPPLLRDLRRLVGASARMTNVSERKVRGWMVRASGAASYLRMPLAYGAFLREQLMRVALGEDAAPWSLRRALPVAVGQVVFPPPVGPAQA